MCQWSTSKSWPRQNCCRSPCPLTYKLSPQHWSHDENAVKEIRIHITSHPSSALNLVWIQQSLYSIHNSYVGHDATNERANLTVSNQANCV